MKLFRALTAALLITAAPLSIAHAEQIAGLTTDQRIVTFDSLTPATIATNVAISGLTGGDRLLGIDMRPANGLIYGVAQTGRVYSLSTTGIASLVTTLSVVPSGTNFGIDFNPVPDRLRIIGDGGQNLRANLADGVVATDTAITRAGGGAINLIGTAYTNSGIGPAPATTVIYGIDSLTGSLMTSASPNGGVYSSVGALGIRFGTTGNVGFDISGRTSTAYMNVDNAFYTINLGTGVASFVGNVSAGSLIGITATNAVPEPTTWAMMISGFGLVGVSMRRRRTIAIA